MTVDREADGRARVPLRIAGLEDVEAPVLDRVLDVLDVAVVAFERREGVEQRGVDLGHPPLEAVEGLRVADPGDHVLALRVEQEVAVGPRLPGRRIARERDAGAGALAHVAEDHPLHRHRGAELGGDPVQPPVGAARSLFQESKTARIAWRSCSRGSSGKLSPV